jgi:hypothetical protein
MKGPPEKMLGQNGVGIFWTLRNFMGVSEGFSGMSEFF